MVGDPKRYCGGWKLRPSPSKAARTILTASNQVKITSSRVRILIYINLFARNGMCRGRRRTAAADLRDDRSCTVLAGMFGGVATPPLPAPGAPAPAARFLFFFLYCRC